MKNKKDYSKNKTKDNIIRGLIIIILLLLIALFLAVLGSKKMIIKKSFNSIAKNTNYYSNIMNNEILSNDEYTISGTLSPNMNIDSKNTLNTNINIDKLNKTDINYNISKNDSDLYTKFNTKINDESIAVIKTILDDDKLYLNLGDDWAKYSQINEIDEEDMDYISDIIKDTFNDTLKNKDYYSSTKETITINNEKIEAKKISLTLEDKDIYNIMNKLIKNLKNDNEAKEILKENEINIDEIKITKKTFKDYKLIYSVYKKSTYGKYIAYDLEITNKTDKLNMTYITDKNDELKLTYNDNEIKFNVEKEKDNFTLKTNINEQEVSTLKYTSKKLENNIDLKIYFDRYYIDINLDNKYDKHGKEYKLNGNYEAFIKYDNQTLLQLNLDNNASIIKDSAQIEEPESFKSKITSYSVFEYISNIINQYLMY